MNPPPKPRPMPPALLAVIARVQVIVSRPQYRERVAREQARRRVDVAALLETRGR